MTVITEQSPRAPADHDDEDERASETAARRARRRRLPAFWAVRLRWLSDQFHERVWPTAVLFVGLASAATLSSSWGAYVGDNRFEQYWNPARRLAKTLSIWDGSRGLGRVREDFWPGPTLPIALLRGLGASPTLAEHLFHALCIAMAGVGMVLVVRLFRPRIGIEHVLAGLVVAFGPFSATFLVPSNLYFHYALAPWLLVVVYRGLHSTYPWRWAAMFALLVFAPGNVDTPGLVYNCVPLISVALFLVFVERSVRVRHVIGWFARAGALTVWVSAVMVAKTYLAAGALGQRLNDTESADIAAVSSSWSESLRGLGNWLSYFTEGQALVKPQGHAYFDNWIVVLFTFVPPCVALFVLWQSRWRVRVLYLMMMLSSLIILVGAFPRNDPSPLGRQILNAYTNIKLLAAFRNTYKIGAGLIIGIAALFAYGVVLGYRYLRRRRPQWRGVPIALAFLTIAVGAHPFWSGELYDPTKTMHELPGYWAQTFDYLGDLPGDGRSLVLPQTSRTRYRWGWVGDDLFDALDSRDHAVVTGVPLSTPIAANALEAVTVAASADPYTPGVLGPMMKRLGLTEVVLRNDLDWQDLERPRPSGFDGLRKDPDFQRVATFGTPGEHTTRTNDSSAAAQYERTLPPVEIFALKTVGSQPSTALRTTGPAPALLVAGDAFAWPGLVQAGLLNGDNPVTYTGDLDERRLTTDLSNGSPLVITDANRRRLRVLVAYEADYSYLLSDGQDLDRPTQSLWPKQPGSQSVAWFPSANSVVMDGPPRSTGGTQVWNRPTLAFDGDPTTSWLIRRLDQSLSHRFRIELREPTIVSTARIVLPANTPAGGGIQKGRLRFSDGTQVEVDLTKGSTEAADIGRHRTSWIEFEPTQVGEAAQTVGIAELGFPDASPAVDLTEYLQTPDDVFRQAAGDPALAAAVRAAPISYVFQRNVASTTEPPPSAVLAGASVTDEETNLRRRFTVAGDRELEVSGVFRLRPDTPDEIIDTLVGGDYGAVASRRQNNSIKATGANVIDGRDDTAWFGPAQAGDTITLRFPAQQVTSVAVRSRDDGNSTRINRVQVEYRQLEDTGPATIVPAPPTAEQRRLGQFPSAVGRLDLLEQPCDRSAATTRTPTPTPTDAGGPTVPCTRASTIELPDGGVYTDHLTVRIADIAGAANPFGRIRIDEIAINGEPNQARFTPDSQPARCLSLGPRLDGTAAVPVTIGATLAELLDGRAVPFTACDPIRLVDGVHLLATDAHAPIDQLQLVSPDLAAQVRRARVVPGPDITVTSRSSTRVELHATNETKGSVLLFGQSFDAGWQATVNGKPLGPPRSFNALNGWVLDETGPLDIELRYAPQRLFGYALVASTVGVAVCVFLILRTPSRLRHIRARGPSRPASAQGPSGGDPHG